MIPGVGDPTVTPYGEWSSPITAASLVSGAVGIAEKRVGLAGGARAPGATDPVHIVLIVANCEL